jgi:hypothetical protein
MDTELKEDNETSRQQVPLKPLVSGEPPRFVWVVSNAFGADYVSSFKQASMDHAALQAGDFPESGPWRVCKYVAEPFARTEFECNPKLTRADIESMLDDKVTKGQIPIGLYDTSKGVVDVYLDNDVGDTVCFRWHDDVKWLGNFIDR